MELSIVIVAVMVVGATEVTVVVARWLRQW